MQKRNRRVWIVVTLVACFAVGLFVWPVVWFVFSYGANFDFPEALPLPQAATQVLSDEGEDDDDPMRSRQQVVDVGDDSAAALLAFYRETYPASKGWTDLPVAGDQELCLVNRSNDKYTEVVEVYLYTGSRVPVQPDRHLVMISRLQDTGGEDPCGMANAWVASDLF